MTPEMEDLIRSRADLRCEYCRMPEYADFIPFEFDHIIPVVHGGPTRLSNLAFSCWGCNCYKGPNLSGIDPETRRITRLYHPRQHKWKYHFGWADAVLFGRTAIGRTTIAVLRINLSHRIAQRQALIDEGIDFFA
jgi:hypothetical protein